MPLDTVGHRSIFIQRDFLGTAEVISENAQLIFISTKEIVRLMSENFDFSRSLIIKISTELSKAESNSFKVKDKTSFERVAEFLFFTAMKYSDIDPNGCYKFKSEIPKNVISSILFMADETVIRVMTDLKKENVIAYDGRIIVVKDLDKLKKISQIVTNNSKWISALNISYY
ncbi:Crp/Fnr family transcriptional regulator [bacterium]|nr:Crp/Fnr family transcriptional regulator [bacterium]